MSKPMTQKTFEQMARIYGAAFRHWPEEVRQEAEEFLAQHPKDAARILGTETWLDQALEHAPRQHPSHHLEEQILRSFPSVDVQMRSLGFRPRARAFIKAVFPARNPQLAWGMALALIMAFGFIGGYSGRTYSLDSPSVAEIMSPAFGLQDENYIAEDV